MGFILVYLECRYPHKGDQRTGYSAACKKSKENVKKLDKNVSCSQINTFLYLRMQF